MYGHQGTDGDAILSILREGRLRPKRDMVWLNIGDYRESYQHGSDTARRAQFVIEVVVTFAEGTVREERKATKGLPQALVLHTDQPLETTVVRMFVARAALTWTTTIRMRAGTERTSSPPARSRPR